MTRGRPSTLHLIDLADEVRSAREELAARDAETVRLIDAAGPHMDALIRMSTELGPIALKHALSLSGVLRRIRLQACPDGLERAA